MKGGVELVFIPGPAVGHLIATVELAKLLLQKCPRHDLSISVLIMKVPFDSKLTLYIDSLVAENEGSSSRLKPVLLSASTTADNTKSVTFFRTFVESHKQSAREVVKEIQTKASLGSGRLAGIVLDMFCVDLMDLADEFGIPAYVFFTSGAGTLGMLLYLQSLRDEDGKDVTEFKGSDPDLEIPVYSKPYPAKLIPGVVLDKTGGGADMFLDFGRKIREAKGIMVNTFSELEGHAMESLSKYKGIKIPPVYPVGPILNLQSDKIGESGEEILEWLSSQPDSSVVFLCFGSGGSFPEPQVKEIASALERSGHRFLWALRKPPAKGAVYPTDFNRPEEALPEGFLERTKDIGKVIGWAPQAAVLAHPAVGGFVSHCGWNSTLESVWFGVPMATWPIYAEQQANAFQLVTDIGMAVDLKMDYIKDFDSEEFPEAVKAEVIEAGIRKLMDNPSASPTRIKAQELKQNSREAMEEGGSSFNFLQSFFDQVFNNLK
ncbi:unnamed protein product [Cuscuta epithymum]|uniref:Glycosyltransferase n=1 Tax=Cuscuta epithymum TaxID=186058 RepID=A0AAV0EAG7_9ASTE|nr:unnamed protein product [Cuscuta epithymum]